MGKTNNPLKTNTFKGAKQEEEPIVPPSAEPSVKKKRKEKEKEKVKEKAPRREKTEEEIEKSMRRYRVVGLLFLLMAAFLLFSFVSYIQSWKVDFNYTDTVYRHFTLNYFVDPAIRVENFMGKIGALAAYLFISKWFGVASFLFVGVLVVSGARLFFRFTLLPVWKTIEYSFYGILWLPVTLGLLFPQNDILYGIYGYQMNVWGLEYLGNGGALTAPCLYRSRIPHPGIQYPFPLVQGQNGSRDPR